MQSLGPKKTPTGHEYIENRCADKSQPQLLKTNLWARSPGEGIPATYSQGGRAGTARA